MNLLSYHVFEYDLNITRVILVVLNLYIDSCIYKSTTMTTEYGCWKQDNWIHICNLYDRICMEFTPSFDLQEFSYWLYQQRKTSNLIS